MVAPLILWRYIARDVLLHTLLGLAVFGIVVVGQNALRFIEQLLAVGAGPGALGRVVLAVLPSYLAYAIPTSLLFGVLVSFGRMSADGEVVAMRASGVSIPRMLPPVFLIGGLCTLATGILSFDVEPRSRHQLKELVRELSSTKVVKPGEFLPLGERIVHVAAEGDEQCPLQGVLIADYSDKERPLFISAQCGSIGPAPDNGIALELLQGSIHFEAAKSDEGHESYRLIRFTRMHTELDRSCGATKV